MEGTAREGLIVGPTMAGMVAAAQVVDRFVLALQASRTGIVALALVAFALQVLFPMQNVWVAGAVAGACLALALALFLVGRPSPSLPERADVDLRHLSPAAAVELSSTVQQFGHAFAMAGLVLAGFAAGGWLGSAFGF